MAERTVEIENFEQVVNLFGSFDEHIKLIEDECDVKLISRGSQIKLLGEEEKVKKAAKAIDGLLLLMKKGQTLDEQNVRYVLTLVGDGQSDKLSAMMADCVCITSKGKPVKAKTLGQEKYLEAIRSNTIVFGIGPAGTGKTYLAVAMAVKAFKAKEISRIILTRPAVEAGESLGFLPGDLQQKVDPYLRPLYDALFEMLGAESFQK
ncbi:MAG: PhoH family protein, partial [Oscillospiraceae bacterium]